MGAWTSLTVDGPGTGRAVLGLRRPARGGSAFPEDSMRQHQPDDEPAGPRRSRFRRFDDFAMRFYGPAARSRRDLRGADASPQTQQWYRNLQEEFVVEKDANGHTYLRRRDR